MRSAQNWHCSGRHPKRSLPVSQSIAGTFEWMVSVCYCCSNARTVFNHFEARISLLAWISTHNLINLPHRFLKEKQ